MLQLHDRPTGSDPASHGDCVLDVGGRERRPGRSDSLRRCQAEDAGEDLRLFYVAAHPGPVPGRHLVGRLRTTPRVGAAAVPLPDDRRRRPGTRRPAYQVAAATRSAPGRSGAQVVPGDGRRPVPGVTGIRRPRPDAGAAERSHASTGSWTLEWRRTSYSALTAAAHGMRAGRRRRWAASPSRPRRTTSRARRSSPHRTAGPHAGGRRPSQRPRRWPSCPPAPSSASRCTRCSRRSTRRRATCRPSCAARATAALARLPAGALTATSWPTGLLPSFATPLGPLAGGRHAGRHPPPRPAGRARLRAAAGRRRASDRGAARSARLAPLLREHLPPDDPLVGYPDAAGRPGAGRPDAARLSSPAASTRCSGCRARTASPATWCVDYKTNWLGPLDGAPLTVGDYTPPRMAEAMIRAHYPLQALLYAVAVHRLLRWRQPGYDPDRHLGGVLYLFVRGMAGPQTPRGRRRALWRVQLAAAGGTGGRAVRPAGRGPAHDATAPWSPRRRRAWPAGARRDRAAGGRSTRPACWSPRTCTPPRDRPDRRSEDDERVLLALALAVRALRNGSVVHRPAHGVDRRSSTRPRRASTCPSLPWPEPDGVGGGLAGEPAGRRRRRPAGRPSAAAGRRACSTWSATGSRRSRSGRRSSNASPPTRRPSTRRGWPRPRPAVPAMTGDGEPDRQRLAAAVSALGWVTRAGRRAGHRQDHHGGAAAGPAPRPARPPAADRAGRADRQGGGPAGGGGAAAAAELPAADRERLGDLRASTLHRLLGWLPGRRGPVPARRQQPAAARRRRGRRDVDGLADPDGPAARGGPADARG